MAKSQKPRKKYNPNKIPEKHFLQRARRCKLYRWEEEDYTPGRFDAYGPYDAMQTFSLMDQAANKSLTWLCVVTAYFIDHDQGYYEEQLSTSPMGPLKLKDVFPEILKIAEEMQRDAKAAGNFKHYRDTCTALYVHSPELEAQLDDDEWIERHARHRASMIRRSAP